jgi:predicted adenylyl cyclase CyaB
MKEFEMRFKRPEGIEDKIRQLGFQKHDSFQMHDLIFEPKEWIPGDDLMPGYFVIRIRLMENRKPKLESKAYINENEWDEITMEIDDAESIFRIFSNVAVPRRVISKYREVWKKDGIEICLDDVTHLGKFIEIEGEEDKVRDIVNKINLKNPMFGYGRQLFYLERDGKITFNVREMEDVLKTFKYIKNE